MSDEERDRAGTIAADDVDDVVGLATELERRASERVDVETMKAIAAELSIDPKYVEPAIANLERRRAELPTAEQLIAAEAVKYWDWVAGLAAVPVLTEMRSRMEELREREVADALRKRLQHLPPAERAAVEELTRTLMNKFLHEPTVRLRAAAANGRGLGVVDTARYLFGLERPADAPVPEPQPAAKSRVDE
jgi:hypothetical protein